MILICSFFLYLFSMASLFAEETLLLENHTSNISLNSKAEIYLDTNGKKTISEFFPKSQISYSSSLPINNEFKDYPIWIHFSVLNSSEKLDWFLEIDYPLLDDLEIFICNKETIICDLKKSGDHREFRSGRDLEYRNFIFKLSLSKKQKYDVYIRAVSSGPLIIPITLWSFESFFEKVNLENYLFGAYYGIVLALFIYNLLIYFSIKDNLYLFYIFHILFIALFSGAGDGIDFEFLWRRFPSLFDNAPVLFMPLMIGSLILFTNRFLNLKLNYPKIHNLFLALTILSALLIFSLYIVSYSVLVRLQAAFSIFVCFYLLLIAIYLSLKEKQKLAFYYIIALFILLVTIIINRARVFGYIDHNFASYQGIKLGSVLEMIFLSLSLGDFVNALKAEKTEVQRKSKEDIELTRKEGEASVVLERHRIYSDIHDNLGGDLVGIIHSLNKFIQLESVNKENLAKLKKTADEAILHLKSRMISVSEVDMISDNLVDGLQLFLIERYSNAGRTVSHEVDPLLENFSIEQFSRFRRETLFLMCKEISTNDLKYGYGESNWKFYLDNSIFCIEMFGNSKYNISQSKGIGMRSLQERANSLNGSITVDLLDHKFHLVLRIPI